MLFDKAKIWSTYDGMIQDEMVGFNVGSVYTYNGSDNNRYIYKSIGKNK